ncbi:hypothetical protein WA538_004757, partial [Blastocystis sp. DL]
MKKRVTCVTQQHQCLIVHKAISCASLNVQVAIHKIPMCDPLQFVLSWVMEKEGSKTRIRIGCQLESKIPFLSGTVASFIQKEAKRVCDLWIQTIQKKEQNEIVLPEPSMPPTGQRRQLGVWLLVFVVV